MFDKNFDRLLSSETLVSIVHDHEYSCTPGIRTIHTMSFQVVPDSLRGCIVGLSALAPKNDLALIINFGSVSLGIPSALSRIFNKVCALLHYKGSIVPVQHSDGNVRQLTIITIV